MPSYVNRDLAHSFRFDVTDSAEYADSASFTASTTGQVVTFGNLTVVVVTPQDANGIFIGQFGSPTYIFDLNVVGVDNGGNAEIAVGDIVYKDVAAGELNADDTNGIPFGIALAAVASGATTEIPVLKTT